MITNILEPKDPTDVKEYRIKWGQVLAAEGESAIASSTWAASDPDGLDYADGSPATGSPPSGYIEGTDTYIFVSGGTAGVNYELTNTIVTASGLRVHQRTIVVPCCQR